LTQKLVFLGASIDLEKGLIFPTLERYHVLKGLIYLCQKSEKIQVRYLLRLLGIMNSCIGLVPWARLHMRPIQLHILFYWKMMKNIFLESCNGTLGLVDKPGQYFCRNTLERQINFSNSGNGCFHDGLGAHLGQMQVSGFWSGDLIHQHIDYLVMMVVFVTVKHFREMLKDQKVLVKTDNTTVMTYINKQGGHTLHPYVFWSGTCFSGL
jgi:hypothetical protein